MNDAYNMVFVSASTFLLLCTTVFFYRYIYPKKKINALVLIILLSILPTISIFRQGDYESGDFNIHVYRAMEFYTSLQEGILTPSWAGNLNATYGYPLFVFIQPLQYYGIVLFHLLGFSFITSAKILLTLSYISSGIVMYLWAKNEFGTKPGFAAAIFYLFAPYHLVDLHFRTNFGELLAFVFVPLCALSIKKIIAVPARSWFIIGSLSFGLLILSHPISITIIPFLIAYSVFLLYVQHEKNKPYLLLQRIITLFIMVCMGICLSAFYWLPAMVESQYTTSLNTAQVTYRNILEYFYSPWRMGLLFQGNKGELSFIIGYIQWILVLLMVVSFFKNRFTKVIKKHALFFVISFGLVFFMMQEISQPFWQPFPMLRKIEFSYRLLVLETFIISAIAALFVKMSKNNFVIVCICFIAIFSTILNWGHRRLIPEINDTHLRRKLPYSTSRGEALGAAKPIWISRQPFWQQTIPTKRLEILKGNGIDKELQRTTTRHEYIIYAKSDLVIKENTLYFPGWNVLVNNIPQKINYTDKKYPGIIIFSLPEGIHKLTVVFTHSPLQIFSRFLSLFTFIAILIIASNPLFRILLLRFKAKA